MASTYSSDLKLELMATGENAGTWGDKTNTNLNLIQQAVAGFEQITLSSGGTVALTMSDGAISNARNLVIKFATATIAASTVCTIPDSIEKFYIFDCSGLTNANNLTIKTASGTGFSPTVAGAASSKIFAAYSDGTNLNEISLNTLGGTIATANLEASAVTTAIIADSAVTTAKIADDAVTSAKIADNAVVTAAINADAVTQAKIADDAVGADQLANTSVTAGSYTLASITVDAQGRLTAASTGAAGGGNLFQALAANGPATGTYTANPAANKYVAFAWAGGGGGSGGSWGPGGKGGDGGFGTFGGSVTGGTGYTYAVGAAGNAGTGRVNQPGLGGNAGGDTSVTNLFTANGGPGGPTNPYGNPSTGPSASNGSVPGGQAFINRNFLIVEDKGAKGNGGPTGNPGSDGTAGALVLYDNSLV